MIYIYAHKKRTQINHRTVLHSKDERTNNKSNTLNDQLQQRHSHRII